MASAACRELQRQSPGVELEIIDVNDSNGIGRYARVLVLPTLAVNEKVVCSGRFTSREDAAPYSLSIGKPLNYPNQN
jgi:hypothetical protein